MGRRTLRALLLHLARLFHYCRGVLCAVGESRCRSGSDAQLPVSPPRALASLPTTAGTGCTACSHHNEATRLGTDTKNGLGVVNSKKRHTKRNACVVVVCGVWCVWCVWGGGGEGRGEGERVWWWWCGGRGGRREEGGGVCVVVVVRVDIEQTHTCKYAPNYGCHVPVDTNPTPCTCVQGSQNCRRLSRREQTRDTLNATMGENCSATWRRAVQKKTPVCICRGLGKRKGVLHQPAIDSVRGVAERTNARSGTQVCLVSVPTCRK